MSQTEQSRYKSEARSDSSSTAQRRGPLKVPAKDFFKGHIKEEDIADFQKRDRRTVLAISKMEQENDWQTEVLEDIYYRFMEQDEEIARVHHERASDRLTLDRMEREQTRTSWQWDILRWLAVTIGAGLMAGVFRWLFGK